MIVDFAKAQQIKRFVHISSPTVYFKLADALLVREDATLPKPINHYAATKHASEKICNPADRNWPGYPQAQRLVRFKRHDASSAAFASRTPPLTAFPKWPGLHCIDDVVAAIIAVLDAGPRVNGEMFNISGGEVLPVRDIVEQTCKIYGVKTQWRPLPHAPVLAVARLPGLAINAMPFSPSSIITPYTLGLFAYAQSLDISKAQNMLDWAPQVRFSEGLRRTHAAGEHV